MNAILAIAYRDLVKFLRDPARLVATFVFPLLFLGIFGETMQANVDSGYDFRVFIFTGVFAQTLFMSAAQGLVSLVEDRENDFSQEMFVTPIPRYSIVIGKVLGETLVALPQGLAVIALAAVMGVPMSLAQLLALIVVAVVVCLFGGAFGVLLVANFDTRRLANQVEPFIMIPQFFLAGVFTPIRFLPWYLDFLSRISPMRYAVDLTRGVFYSGSEDFSAVVLDSPALNALIVAGTFAVFIAVGTWIFVRKERNH